MLCTLAAFQQRKCMHTCFLLPYVDDSAHSNLLRDGMASAQRPCGFGSMRRLVSHQRHAPDEVKDEVKSMAAVEIRRPDSFYKLFYH